MSQAEQKELFQLPRNPSTLTVGEGLDLLWRFHLSGKASGLTFLSNRKAICRALGHKRIDQVNEVDIARYKEARGLTVGTGTVGHDHTVITLLFNKLYAWKRKRLTIEGIDFSNLSLPGDHPTFGIGKKKAPPRNVVITPDEFSRLLEHSTDRLIEVLYFAIYTGIRRGDLMKLTLGNYNMETNQIEFVQNKTGKWACIPANKRVKEIITRAAKEQRKTILDFTNFDFEWRLAKHNAKLKHKQFRDLRRSLATTSYKLCKDPRKVRDLLGHASERTTMEVYVVTEKQDLLPLVRNQEKVFA
jgi:integrase